MAIIKYNLVNGRKPSYITDGGYWRDTSDDTLIGIGSGGGTELTKAELITRALSCHARRAFPYIVIETNTSSSDYGNATTNRDSTNAEVTTMITNWCTARGIS